MDTLAASPIRRTDRRLSPVPTLLTLMLLAWWLLSFVDSAFQQAQMAVFADNVIIPRWTLDALMLCALGWMVLQRGWQPQLPTALLTAWAMFGACLLVSAVFLEARFGGVLDDLIPTYYRIYFLSLLLPLATALEGSFKPQRMEVLLMIVALPLAGIGLDQYLKNDPVLPTVANGNTWQVYAWKLEEQVRAFSLFNSGWSFGHFMIFVGLIALYRSVQRRQHWLLALAYLGISAFCVYICRTRTAYLVGGAAIVNATLMLWVPPRHRERLLALLPMFWLFVAYMVASGIKSVLHFLGIGGDGGVLNSASLDARHESWAQYAEVWFHDWANALFGAAVTQKDSGQMFGESTVLIDNAFIAIGAQIGLVGLLLWMFMFWRTWRFLLAETLRREDALSLAIASVWAAWPFSLMFNASSVYYCLLALLAVLSRSPQLPQPLRHRQTAGAQLGEQALRH